MAQAEARATLHYWDSIWTLSEKDCPCDIHFVRWLEEQGIVDSSIYHFGSGAHHLVGIECAREDRRNAVLSITAAPKEHDTYIELAIARPEVLRHYNCVFGDIYLINPNLIPDLDVVTLFHLCEFRSDKTDSYGGLTDLEVTEMLTDRLRPGGHILFYTGSFAFGGDGANNATKVIAAWEKTRDVERVGLHESLLVYRKRS